MTSTLAPRRPSEPSADRGVRRDDRRLHLHKRARRALLVVHVLSSVAWLGIAVFVLFMLVMARSTGDADYARALYRTVETSIWLSVPMGAVSGLTGLVLGLGTPWGVATHWWVVLKEIAFIPLVVTDFLVVAPGAHDLAHGGSGSLLEPAIGHCVLLTLATVVSIVKPFGRTPRGRRRLPSRG
jgi:hypothetical protein